MSFLKLSFLKLARDGGGTAVSACGRREMTFMDESGRSTRRAALVMFDTELRKPPPRVAGWGGIAMVESLPEWVWLTLLVCSEAKGMGNTLAVHLPKGYIPSKNVVIQSFLNEVPRNILD